MCSSVCSLGFPVGVAVAGAVGVAVAGAVGVGDASSRRRSTWRARWRWRRRCARCQDVALSASSRLTGAVAEVLVKGGVVLLHSGCGRCVAVSHCAVDHVKACLPLVQPQLEAGTAASREVLCTPLNVEDAVGSSATYRCEYAEPTVDQIQVVPIREDACSCGWSTAGIGW